jgi:hypothetical protein
MNSVTRFSIGIPAGPLPLAQADPQFDLLGGAGPALGAPPPAEAGGLVFLGHDDLPLDEATTTVVLR